MKVWGALQRAISKNRDLFPSLGSMGTAMVPPLYPGAAFRFDSEKLQAHHSNPTSSHRYLRDSSPNTRLLEEVFQELHPGFGCLSFSSGMSAISALLLGPYKSELMIFQDETYRKTKNIAQRLMHEGIQVKGLGEYLENEAGSKKDLPVTLFLESPSNPHFRMVDIKSLSRSMPTGSKIVLDATFSGLGNLTPEALNAVDSIVYSLTKYVGGHNDLLGGVALVSSEDRQKVYDARSDFGSILDPYSATLVVRSLETFDLRFERYCETAQEIVEELKPHWEHGDIPALYFPGDASNGSEQQFFEETMLAKGGVFSFVSPLELNELRTRIDKLEFFWQAPSFGSNKPLIEIPSQMSYASLSDEELIEIGVEKNLVRVSAGIERVENLARDIMNLVR